MTTSEWLKPGIYGTLFGAAFVGIVGFSWGGWMKVIAALVPVCLEKYRTDNERIAKLADIRAASSFKRREAVMEAGWATIPGSDGPNRDLAQACIEGLDLDK